MSKEPVQASFTASAATAPRALWRWQPPYARTDVVGLHHVLRPLDTGRAVRAAIATWPVTVTVWASSLSTASLTLTLVYLQGQGTFAGKMADQTMLARLLTEQYGRDVEITSDDLARFFVELAPQLDERQRRLVYGATARLIGRGGVTAVSRAAGASRNTVAAGAAEMEAVYVPQKRRVRRPGAGRKSVADRDPQLLEALQTLLTHQSGAEVPLQWTLMSSYEIATELRQLGFAIGPSSVGHLMLELGYVINGRGRPTSPAKVTELHEQYSCLTEAVSSFGAAGQPVICARSSKSELSGTGEINGADTGAGVWTRVAADLSVVEFAAEAIQRWWAQASPHRFSDANKLLICSDTYDNDQKVRDGWKYHLDRLAHATGLDVTIQRIPHGAWRWRDFEGQYSYTVTLDPLDGAAARCDVAVDLITDIVWPGIRGTMGGDPSLELTHDGECDCQYTAHPTQHAEPAAPVTTRELSPDGAPSAVTQPDGNGTTEMRPQAERHDVGSGEALQAFSGPAEQRKAKMAEVVAHDIVRDISTRRLRPGARLPSETGALARFGVSRSSLREALRLLELLGVIRIKTGAGGGPIVGQVTSADYGSTTTFYYHLVGVTIRQILEARCILEPELVRVAVERADPVARGKLRAYMNSWGGDEALSPNWHAPRNRPRTFGFHRSLIDTGNAVLDLFSHSLQDVWHARQRMEPFPWQAAPHYDDDHWVIAQAILAGDASQAAALMRTHMQYLYDVAAMHWPEIMDEVIDWHLSET
jgi:GntR family transcriptional regulator, transcriptional repressor for pyruvate dehydrogenase complex